MRKASGVALTFDERGKIIENETFTCKHCQKVVLIPHQADPSQMGGFCYSCAALVCPACYGKPCEHFEKKLERAEAQYHARRSYGF